MAPRRLLLAAVVLAVAPAPAAASVGDPAVLDGPAAGVEAVDGVAMAEDGTGGVVYRRTVDGTTHVYAAAYRAGGWQPPQRVDAGQAYGSSFPVIGAADGGRLVVAWVQEFGVSSDRLYSATLGQGARRFQAPVLVDGNVGEATATFPSLAMSRGGSALLTYNVVSGEGTAAGLPAGTALVERRIARYSGRYWSGFGFPFNRNTAAPTPSPTAANSPRVVIDTAGNGIVAWQEADDDLVPRLWARRVFSSTIGLAQQVSPSSWEDKPLRAGVDAFSLDTAGFGQGALAFRQLPATGSAFSAPVAMAALVPETFSPDAAAFAAPRVIDGGAGGPSGPGAPDVAVTADGHFLAGFSAGTAAVTVAGDDRGLEAPQRLDAGASTVAPDPQLDLAGSGASAAAFPVAIGRTAGVAVQEGRADGVPAQRTVSSPRGGAVADVRLAGSGLGDAIVAFRQGTGAAAQVVAAVVDAPPDGFQVQTPVEWTRAKAVELRWDPAAHAIGGVTYAVTVDDEVVADGLTTTRHTLKGDALGAGRETVAVIATDAGGQETTSVPALLKVDRDAPQVTIRRRGRRGVRVRIRDPLSGVDAAASRLRIGKGRLLRGKRAWTLRLTRGGRYAVTVTAADKAGNRRTVTRKVRFR